MVVKDFQRIVEGLEREKNGGGNLPSFDNQPSQAALLAPTVSSRDTAIAQSSSQSSSDETSMSELNQLLTLIKSNPGILSFLNNVTSASSNSTIPGMLESERNLKMGDNDEDEDDL